MRPAEEAGAEREAANSPAPRSAIPQVLLFQFLKANSRLGLAGPPPCQELRSAGEGGRESRQMPGQLEADPEVHVVLNLVAGCGGADLHRVLKGVIGFLLLPSLNKLVT